MYIEIIKAILEENRTKSEVLYNKYYHTILIDDIEIQSGNMRSVDNRGEWLSVRFGLNFHRTGEFISNEISFYKDRFIFHFFDKDDMTFSYDMSEEEFFMHSTASSFDLYDNYEVLEYFKELRDVFFAGDPR